MYIIEKKKMNGNGNGNGNGFNKISMIDFIDALDIPYIGINSHYDDNNKLTIEEIDQFKRLGYRTNEKGYRFNTIQNPALFSLFLKHTKDLYCLDVDIKKEDPLSNDEIHSIIKKALGTLPPFSISRNKGRPHYYFCLENIKAYSNEINIFKAFEADLIKNGRNMWELSNSFVFNFDEDSFPVFDWEDIKNAFNIDKMNFNDSKDNKKNIGNNKMNIQEPQKEEIIFNNETKTDLNNKTLNAIECLKHLNPKRRAYDFDSWLKLLFICKNLLIPFEYFDEISRLSGYENYSKEETFKAWENHKEKPEKNKLGFKTLLEWIKEDDPEFYKSYVSKYPNIIHNLLTDYSHAMGAELFNAYHKDELYYSKATDFICYNSTLKVWMYDITSDEIANKISSFFRSHIKKEINKILYNSEKETAEDERLKKLSVLNMKTGDVKWAQSVAKYLSGIIKVESSFLDKFNSNPFILPFNNGICYDFTIKAPREIKKEDFIIKTTGYPWKNENKEWMNAVNKEFLYSLFENEEMTKSLLSALSCSLVGRNINEKFFVLTGSGRNGKSSIECLFSSVLGSFYKSLDSKQLTSYEHKADSANSELAGLMFSRCAMVGEPEDSNSADSLKVSTIKKWTGCDPITTRRLYKDSITFNPQFTLFLLCNDIPKLSKKDGGISERMKIINFPFRFTGEEGQELEEGQRVGNRFLKEKLKSEEFKYGFLHLLINTYNNLNGAFYEPEQVKNETKDYLNSQNPLREWFLNTFELDEKGKLTASEIYSYYNENKENKKNIVEVRVFGRFLKELCGQRKTAGKEVYKCKFKASQCAMETEDSL